MSRPPDLIRDFAAPWSLELAVLATGASHAAREHLSNLARRIFLAASDGDEAREATAELSRAFPLHVPAIAVQAFVALSQTLPCFLGNAWYELIRNPGQMSYLRAHRGQMPEAIEELLRFAGPSRAVFRQTTSGERIALMLAEANRDPAQFADPDRLDFRRGGAGHLAFGGGPHSCSGAPLIRKAAALAACALLDATGTLELNGEPEWIGGFAIRGIVSLPITAQWRETPPAID